LLGLNPPQGRAVQIVQHPAADQSSSLDRIRAALDRVRGKSAEGNGLPGIEGPNANGGEEKPS
jgi:hypothetical protein